jgi:hypothetical protein
MRQRTKTGSTPAQLHINVADEQRKEEVLR